MNIVWLLPERRLDDIPHGQDQRDGRVALLATRKTFKEKSEWNGFIKKIKIL